MITRPRRYQKKPVRVEAMRFYDDSPGSPEMVQHRLSAVARWCGGRLNADAKPSDHTDIAYTLSVPTLEGVMTAQLGDYIIKGIHGEFYPCKPDIFVQTYERITR